ncbi:hypothetical protein D3C84_907810 [compost metagenome]
MCRQPLQGVHQLVIGLGWHAHPQDPGKLPGHPRHATLQPVAAMLGDALGDTLDLAGLVWSENGKYEVVHGAALLS